MSTGLVLTRHGDLSLTPNVQWYIPMLVGLVYGGASPKKICESQWGYFLSNRLNETEKVTLKPTKSNLQSWLYPQIDHIPMFLRYIHNAYWKQPSSIISIEYQFAGYIFY